MDEFKSLNWLRNSIRYVLEVIAALSILLLTIGLVSASWNFLDKDALFGNAPLLQSLWALDQALAIDANLPLTFVILFAAIKRKDWVFVVIYTLIGAVLLFVASIILGTESLRQALNVNLDVAASEIHVPVELLTLMRSGATIGLVAMSGLNIAVLHVKNHKGPETAAPVTEPEPLADPSTENVERLPEPEKTSTKPETEEIKPSSNGHTPVEDKYQRYLELITVNPKATRPELAAQLGVSESTISNYRRKERKSHDELEVLSPVPLTEDVLS